jgi:SAM-dependent methyltransferase
VFPALGILRCPVSGEPLLERAGALETASGAHRYRMTPSGIPLFAEQFCSEDAKVQQAHYDRVADAYLRNLGYPHTQAYMEYLDRSFFHHLGREPLGRVAELCCGRGEAFGLLGERVGSGIGVDVSVAMLEAARKDLPSSAYTFVQGDATMLPLQDACVDNVMMLGGIHHVRDRDGLFSEVHRILRPGGRFMWREPVSDFFLWRWLRAVVYRLSPALDHETERPLLYRETVPPLERAGLRLESWSTYGFLGFCIFMNSDVLVFNRAFKYVPGIRGITRAAARFDDLVGRMPGMSRAGLQVVGVARKPGAGDSTSAGAAK